MNQGRDDDLEAGGAALRDGRLEDATRIFEKIFVERGEAALAELRLLRGLTLAYGRAGRLFEALVAGRQFAVAARAASDPRSTREATALCAVCMVNCEEPARGVLYLDALDVALREVRPSEDPAGWLSLHAGRMIVDAVGGRLAEAEEHYKALVQLHQDPSIPGPSPWHMANTEFQMARERGDLEAMRSAWDRVAKIEDEQNVHAPDIAMRTELACALLAGTELRAAAELADEVHAVCSGRTVSSDIELRSIAELVEALIERAKDTERAKDLAGHLHRGMRLRIAALEKSAPTLDPLIRASDATLAGALQQDFVAAILQPFRERERQLALVGMATKPEALEGRAQFVVCAWCNRLRVADESWISLAAVVPETRPDRVTHGICEPCAERMNAPLD